jgi:hypothetical protein
MRSTVFFSQSYAGGNRPPPKKNNNFRKPWKFGKMLGKIKKIRADFLENMLNSGYSITSSIKFGQTFNYPPSAPSLIVACLKLIGRGVEIYLYLSS